MADEKSHADLNKVNNKIELDEAPMRHHMMFMAAAMAGGMTAGKADREAADAMTRLRDRFT